MADMTLEEALAAATVDEELVTPVNEVLLINPETRKINIPESEKLFGVRQDMDAERKYFKCPKIVGDNIDLSKHKIFVNYVPSKQDGTYEPKEKVKSYWCEDLATDGDFVTFSWKLSANVMRKAGYIAFAVYAKTIDENGILKTKWHTTIAIGNVLETLPDGEVVEELYPDVIMQLLARMDNLESSEHSVLYVGQELTKEQKNQARENIGAASSEEVSKLSEEIADLKENGTGTGGGLNTTSQALLRQLLEATVYDSDVLPQPQTVIDAFFNSLGGGSDEPVEPDVPDVPVDPDEPVVQYSITNNLTNCTNSNSLTSIEEGSSYTAVISANEGYELESVAVTHDGADVTVTDGSFTIASVSGDIVITANAVEKADYSILYQVTEREYNNTDTPETTGFAYGGYDTLGYLSPWTMTLSMETSLNERQFLFGSANNSNGGNFYIYVALDGISPRLRICLQGKSTELYAGDILGKTRKVVITHEAEEDKDITIYFVSSDNVVNSTVLSIPTNGFWHSAYYSEYVFGGIKKEHITSTLDGNFVGTVHDFTIYNGKCFTEEEAKAYLGV